MDPMSEYMLLENRLLLFFVMNQRRKYWVNDIFSTRGALSEFKLLFPDLKKDRQKFYEYFRMMPSTFEYILEKITPKLRKQSNFRTCIEPEEKLAITLRYLSIGLAFRSLAFSFRLAHTTIRLLVYHTCETIWDEFNVQHMPLPSQELFSRVAEAFYDKWKFPNCAGAIDGKHIRIKCPANSGSMYYNYKNYYSVVLQAVADANYRFICIDIGGYGKQSDGGTFTNSTLYDRLESNSMNLPGPRKVPNSEVLLPHVFVGDEAYPLKTYLMRPYPRKDLGNAEENFNFRLSKARRVVECEFGILSSKWRILLKEIEVDPDKVDKIIKCICLLHNIIIDQEDMSKSFATQNLENNLTAASGISTLDQEQIIEQVEERTKYGRNSKCT